MGQLPVDFRHLVEKVDYQTNHEDQDSSNPQECHVLQFLYFFDQSEGQLNNGNQNDKKCSASEERVQERLTFNEFNQDLSNSFLENS